MTTRWGDTAVSILLFRGIRKKYPNIEIIVFCGRSNGEIIRYSDNVDQIYETGKSFFWEIF
ncbi:MAG: hypothetical protein LBN01_00745 [Endomicrobium sp.]|jgi:ADP-heptose:LPS heptosyltransferase|nr:hypothetical protein [Endomicrobium sp.]